MTPSIPVKVEDLRKIKVALETYADESNWGNGGWEGHPSDYFKPSRVQRQRGWEIAQEIQPILSRYVKNDHPTPKEG